MNFLDHEIGAMWPHQPIPPSETAMAVVAFHYMDKVKRNVKITRCDIMELVDTAKRFKSVLRETMEKQLSNTKDCDPIYLVDRDSIALRILLRLGLVELFATGVNFASLEQLWDASECDGLSVDAPDMAHLLKDVPPLTCRLLGLVKPVASISVVTAELVCSWMMEWLDQFGIRFTKNSSNKWVCDKTRLLAMFGFFFDGLYETACDFQGVPSKDSAHEFLEETLGAETFHFGFLCELEELCGELDAMSPAIWAKDALEFWGYT